ncbi:MAG: biliverdin-producing heme oxygenase [Betaproteobacteria bacterium]|nr:biliverdin-producing heme oxygenase [Betaproteobacteria bacterium]
MTDLALSERLRDSTRAMHRLAERNAYMGELLAGRLPREAYGLYLRNLQALYHALERELSWLSRDLPTAHWILPSIFRAGNLAADLDHLVGSRWPALPVTSAITAYNARIASVAKECPHRLAAHAYVRYLGDLSGGQVIRDVVRRAYGLGDGAGAAFYDFDSAGDPATLKALLRSGLDAYGEAVGRDRASQIADEAVDAFDRHRALFDELRGAEADA